jgi:hypothetical protein
MRSVRQGCREQGVSFLCLKRGVDGEAKTDAGRPRSAL